MLLPRRLSDYQITEQGGDSHLRQNHISEEMSVAAGDSWKINDDKWGPLDLDDKTVFTKKLFQAWNHDYWLDFV